MSIRRLSVNEQPETKMPPAAWLWFCVNGREEEHNNGTVDILAKLKLKTCFIFPLSLSGFLSDKNSIFVEF